ncbi:NTP transferase domain-containing protein [Chloroflexota bacterium]
MNVTSIVLAGGKNTRLGRNKALETIDGKSLIERVVERLRPLTRQLLVVTSRERSNLLAVGKADILVDLYPDKGPLGGLYTGLLASRSSRSVVAACDMPFLNRALLSYMIQISASFDLVIPRLNNMVEPLHAVYSRDCLAHIEHLLKLDRLSLLELLTLINVRYVEAEEINRYDPKHLSFFNVNTEDDLEKARKLVKEEDSHEKYSCGSEVLRERHAVTVFLESENEILILLGSKYVSTSKGRWAGISGSMDDGRTTDEQALVEIEEETSVSRGQVKLIKRGKPLLIADETLCLMKVVHPYLFHINDRSQIKTNWEHKQIRWIKPGDIDSYKTMPKLKEALAKVLS